MGVKERALILKCLNIVAHNKLLPAIDLNRIHEIRKRLKQEKEFSFNPERISEMGMNLEEFIKKDFKECSFLEVWVVLSLSEKKMFQDYWDFMMGRH